MYQKGDFVVKLANGVCKIEDIVHPDFVRDKDKMYYQLMPLSDEKARLYVPIDKLDETTRTVMKKSRNEIVEIIKTYCEKMLT